MKVFHGRLPSERFARACVAIGVFDGVHIGHRRILKAAVLCAQKNRGISVALTFYPHPQSQKIIYSLQHRLRIFRQLGMDVCVVIPFDRRFKNMAAGNFARTVLSGRLGARDVFIGDNFRFGRGQEAGVRELVRFGKELGFRVHSFKMVRRAGAAVSSTAVRGLICDGDLVSASVQLGRRVSILGTVIHGSSLGKKLGFATANISPHHEVVPPDGIYAVLLRLGPRSYNGICYIGSRPTFCRKRRVRVRTIEVHVFDFRRNIYAKDIEVEFVRKIRDDRKFSSADLLVKQIKKDIVQARQILSAHHSYHNRCYRPDSYH